MRRSAMRFIVASTAWLLATLQVFAAEVPPPRQCYSSFLKTVYYARSLEDVAQYFPKAQRELFKKMTSQQKYDQLKTYKSYYLGKAKVKGEKIEGKSARLQLSGVGIANDKPYYARSNVEMVLEDSYWRIAGASMNGEI